MSGNALRLRNAWARLRAGLPARGPVLSPEVPNDLFQAHRAFYAFAAGLAAERGAQSILDLGCGTGYGTADLAAAGAHPAVRAVGIDPDARLLRYSRRRFRAPGLEFREARAEALPGDLGTFDLIVAGNVLSHLADPDAALDAVAECLAPGGAFVASAPPILDGQTLARHRAIPGHRSSRFLWEWDEALRARLPRLRLFRCLPPPGVHPDFTDPGPSHLAPADFRFEEIPAADLDDVGGLAAVFVASRD